MVTGGIRAGACVVGGRIDAEGSQEFIMGPMRASKIEFERWSGAAVGVTNRSHRIEDSR